MTWGRMHVIKGIPHAVMVHVVLKQKLILHVTVVMPTSCLVTVLRGGVILSWLQDVS